MIACSNAPSCKSKISTLCLPCAKASAFALFQAEWPTAEDDMTVNCEECEVSAVDMSAGAAFAEGWTDRGVTDYPAFFCPTCSRVSQFREARKALATAAENLLALWGRDPTVNEIAEQGYPLDLPPFDEVVQGLQTWAEVEAAPRLPMVEAQWNGGHYVQHTDVTGDIFAKFANGKLEAIPTPPDGLKAAMRDALRARFNAAADDTATAAMIETTWKGLRYAADDGTVYRKGEDGALSAVGPRAMAPFGLARAFGWTS